MFLTGEFSKIARVSKRVLQYYDEIGLLHPTYTDPQTGYRYYSARQLTALNRILALKELGLTLSQIAQMLADDVSDDKIQGMLLMQKAQLEQKLLEDLERLRRIEVRLQANQGMTPDVVIKSIPPLDILSTSHFCLNSNDGLQFVAFLMQHLPAKVGTNHLGHFIALADVDEFVSENVDLEFGFLLETDVASPITITDGVILASRTLPAVAQMATAVHVGIPADSGIAYNALGQWIEHNGYRIIGQQREIFLELPQQDKSQEATIEIQFPVEKSQTELPSLPY